MAKTWNLAPLTSGGIILCDMHNRRSAVIIDDNSVRKTGVRYDLADDHTMTTIEE